MKNNIYLSYFTLHMYKVKKAVLLLIVYNSYVVYTIQYTHTTAQDITPSQNNKDV